MRIKLRPAIGSIILLLTGTCIGYLGAMRGGAPFLAVNKDSPGVDYFLNTGTFSEIENTKSLLRAESDDIIAGVRARYGELREAEIGPAIEELEYAIEELKGTGEELILVQELLRFLKKGEFKDRWLEVYLDVLYNHPTDTLVGMFVGDALHAAKAGNREDELIRGLRSLSAIPIDFDGKQKITEALNRWNPRSQIARNHPLPSY